MSDYGQFYDDQYPQEEEDNNSGYSGGSYSASLPPPSSSYGNFYDQQPYQDNSYNSYQDYAFNPQTAANLYSQNYYDDAGMPNQYYQPPDYNNNNSSNYSSFYNFLPPSYDDAGMPSYNSAPSYFAPAYDDTGMPTDSSYKPQFDSGNVWGKLSNIATGFFNPVQQQPYQNDYPTTDFLTGQTTDQQFNPGGSQYLTDQQANQHLDQGVNNNWLSGLAKGALEVAGTPFVLAGKGLEGVADANIPGVSDFARDLGPAIGNTWGTALQAAQSTYGAVRSGQFPNPANPTSYETQFMLGLRPQAAGNDVLANIKSREQPGLQAFGQLSPEEQLAFTFFDPTNKFVDATIHPYLEGAKGLYEGSPLQKGAETVQQALESPQSKNRDFTVAYDQLEPRLQEYADDNLNGDFHAAAQQFIDDPAFRKDIGFRGDYEKVGNELADTMEGVYAEGTAKKYGLDNEQPATGGPMREDVQAQMEAQGYEGAKATNLPDARNFDASKEAHQEALRDQLYQDYRKSMPQEEATHQAEIDSRVQTNDIKSPASLDQFRQENPSVAKQADSRMEQGRTAPTPLRAGHEAYTDPLKEAGIEGLDAARRRATGPNRPDEATRPLLNIPKYVEALHPSEYGELVKKYNGVKTKALIPDKVTGQLRAARPLEQFGLAGRILRGPDFLSSFMSRAFLNGPGRPARDIGGNMTKAGVEGYSPFSNKARTQKFEKLNLSSPDLSGGMSRDAAQSKRGLVSNLFYGAINPAGEGVSWALRGADKLTKGKYKLGKDVNEFTEHRETTIKENVRQQAALRQYEDSIKQEFAKFKQTGIEGDKLNSLLRDESIDQSLINNIAADKLPSANLEAALSGEYDLHNLSDPVVKAGDRLDGTPFAPIKEVFNDLDGKAAPGTPEFDKTVENVKQAVDSTFTTLVENEAREIKKANADLSTSNAIKFPSMMKQALMNWQDRNANYFKAKYEGKDIVSQRNARAQISTTKPQPKQEAPKAPATKVIPEFPVKDLAVDPDRFQYKMLPADSGATGSLSGVQKFDRDLSGTILAWKDPADGKTYVVNGHNRVDLAKKLGQDTLTVRMLDAKDAPEARSTGALANIAEGRGDAIDAAKFFRDTKLTADEIRAKGIPLKEKIAQDGLALSNLNDPIFNAVAKRQFPVDRAIIIGEKLPDHAAQNRLITMLDKYEQKGKTITNRTVGELADQIKESPTTVTKQETLFGTEESTRDYALEKADLAGYIKSELASDKRVFGTAARSSGKLEKVGKVDAAAAKDLSGQAAQMIDLFDSFKNKRGEVSDILNDAAIKLGGEGVGPKRAAKIKQDTYERIREALPDAIKGREGTGTERGSRLPEREPEQGDLFTSRKETGPAENQASLFGESDREEPKVQPAATAPKQVEGSRLATPEEKASPNKPRVNKLKEYYDAIYNSPRSSIPSPSALKQMARKYNAVSPAQRKSYFDTFRRADENIRAITGNEYKLSPETFEPVRSSDGRALRETYLKQRAHIKGEEPPNVDLNPVDTDLTPTPETLLDPTQREQLKSLSEQIFGKDSDAAVKFQEGLDRVQTRLKDYGIDHTRPFEEMNPAERDLAYSVVSREILGADPLDPHVVYGELTGQHTAAQDYINKFVQDASERQRQAELSRTQSEKNARAQSLENKAQIRETADQLRQQISLARQRAKLAADRKGYDEPSRMFFDYQKKNLVDQTLTNWLPFQFWARQNFAYLVRHFAAHPMHFAALLNFYQNLEEQNQKNGVPQYAQAYIQLWQNPDGSRVMWNFSNAFSFNFGEGDSPLQLVGQDDPRIDQSQASNPLARLFGYDITNSKGKYLSREKGWIPTFFRPNPIIDTATKLGLVSDFYKAVGWTSDNFGNPGPKDKQTLGLIPGKGIYQTLGAATGLAKTLRNNKILSADIDLEGPINNLLFGFGAGKPISAMQKELALMEQTGQISQKQAMESLAAIKNGNWTPESLAALDRVEANTLQTKLLSYTGFSTTLINTQGDQTYDAISKAFDAVDKTDKKAVAQFFKDNPGANVMFNVNKAPDDITASLATSENYAAQQPYFDQLKEYDQLKGDKAAQAKYQQEHPDFAKQYNQFITDKYGKPSAVAGKTPEQIKQTDDYYAKLKDYQALKGNSAAQAQFKKDNPEFGKQYDDYIKQTYPNSTTAKGGNTSSSKSYTITPKKSTSTYKPYTSSSTAKKTATNTSYKASTPYKKANSSSSSYKYSSNLPAPYKQTTGSDIISIQKRLTAPGRGGIANKGSIGYTNTKGANYSPSLSNNKVGTKTGSKISYSAMLPKPTTKAKPSGPSRAQAAKATKTKAATPPKLGAVTLTRTRRQHFQYK